MSKRCKTRQNSILYFLDYKSWWTKCPADILLVRGLSRVTVHPPGYYHIWFFWCIMMYSNGFWMFPWKILGQAIYTRSFLYTTFWFCTIFVFWENLCLKSLTSFSIALIPLNLVSMESSKNNLSNEPNIYGLYCLLS